MIPSATIGVELLPVNGRLPPSSALNTDVELTVGPNDVDEPCPTTVVSPAKFLVVVLVDAPVVEEATSVEPDTSVTLVVVSATVLVVSWGWVVSSCGAVVVDVHLQVVGG
jgi:hypothetical protein